MDLKPVCQASKETTSSRDIRSSQWSRRHWCGWGGVFVTENDLPMLISFVASSWNMVEPHVGTHQQWHLSAESNVCEITKSSGCTLGFWADSDVQPVDQTLTKNVRLCVEDLSIT